MGEGERFVSSFRDSNSDRREMLREAGEARAASKKWGAKLSKGPRVTHIP